MDLEELEALLKEVHKDSDSKKIVDKKDYKLKM